MSDALATDTEEGHGVPLAAVISTMAQRRARRLGERAPEPVEVAAPSLPAEETEPQAWAAGPLTGDASIEEAGFVDDPADAATIEAPHGVPASLERPATLASVVPANANPVWVATAALSVAEEHAAMSRTPTVGAWFAEAFTKEYLRTFSTPPSPQVAAREADFLEAGLRVSPGGRILDLACGPGRHTISLARRGYDLVGLDLSIDMLQHGLGQAQVEGLAVKFVHGDMRDLNFDEAFDGAYCWNTGLGYFSEPENLTVLSGLYRGLKPGGRLVIGVLNRDYALEGLPRRNWWEADGCLVQEDIEYNALTSRIAVKRYIVFADGQERVADISLRLYSAHELTQALELVGFNVLDVTGSIHTPGAFFGPFSPDLLITAEKP